MKILYWNLHRQRLEELLADIAREHRPEIIVLSEFEMSESGFLNLVNQGRSPKYMFMERGRQNGQILVSTYNFSSFTNICDQSRISGWRFNHPSGLELLVFLFHLPSKLYQSMEDQLLLSPRWRETIEKAEDQAGHRRTLLVGDMNMDPFECGIISSEGLHAVGSRRIARKESRMVLGQRRLFFYNPMWRHFGERGDSPPGTFFFDRSGKPINYFWHIFDQVLIRPELLDYFQDESIRILTRAGTRSLVDENGVPDKINASDHLPIIFSVKMDQGGSNEHQPEFVGKH